MVLRQKIGLFVLLGSVIGGGALSFLLPYAADEQLFANAVAELAEHSYTPWIIGLATFLSGIVVFPAMAFTLVAGFLYQWKGGFIIYPSIITGSILGYAVGRYFSQHSDAIADDDQLAGYKKRISTLVEERGILASLIVRSIPGIPFAIQNSVMGALRVRFRDYMIGTLIGLAGSQAFALTVGMLSAGLLQHAQKVIQNGWLVQLGGGALGLVLIFLPVRKK